MLMVLIAIAFVCWIVGFLINGITLYSCMILVPTIMFSLRKIGIYIKGGSITTTEVLLLFFSVMWRLLFSNFHLVPFILTILVRAVFLVMVFYDDTAYVYVTEERKKK